MRPLAYSIGPTRVAGATVTVARLRCAECSITADRRISGGHNPEATAKHFRALGWEIASAYATRCLCPNCVAAKRCRPRNDEESIVTKPAATLRDATPDEKSRIRHLLDKHFDDSVGRYIDGYSDERVGRELDIPHAIVTRIREAAYGPIRVDPDVEALRLDITKAEAAIAEHGANLSALVSTVTGLRDRLAKLESR